MPETISTLMSSGAGSVDVGDSIVSGGTLIEAGTASGTTISSGGVLNVVSGGFGAGTMVMMGGSELIGPGSTESAGVLGSRGVLIVSGGTASFESVKSGGTAILASGAMLQSATVSAGGTVIVSSGEVVSGDLVASGVTLVIAGGTALGTTVARGGNVIVSSGIASGTMVASGATLTVDSGTAIGSIVSGTETATAGTSLDDTILGSGAELFANGATISNITVASGGLIEDINFAGENYINGATISSGGSTFFYNVAISNLSSASGALVQLSEIFVVSGAVTSVIGTVLNGGSFFVGNGATAILVPSDEFAQLTVSSGGSVTLTQSYSTVSGTEEFSSNQVLGGAQVNVSGGSGDSFEVTSNTIAAGGVITVSGVGASEFADKTAGTLVIGSGAITSGASVLAGGSMILNSGAVVSGLLEFANTSGTIVLGGTSAVTVVNFNPGLGDKIVLSGLAFSAGATLSNLTSAIVVTDGAASETINLDFLATGAAPVLTDDAGSLAIACYAAGTRIATARGAVPVEQIAVGEMLMRAHGGSAPVIWVGRRTLDLTRHAEPEYAKPVRVLAGAIEPGRPARDLVVSPRHALCIDGALYEAISLINGATIRQEHEARRITYHHLELAAHDVIIAEGQPAESYVDRGNRHMFEGQASLWLHPRPDEGVTGETCLPVHRDGPALEALRMRLIARALGMGFVSGDAAAPEVLAGGRRLRPMRDGLYVLPPGLASVVLRSAPFYAGETTSALADKRRLGTALRGARLLCGVQVLPIDLGGSRHRGMYPAAEGTVWTDGNATLALPAYRGTAMLQIDMAEAPARLMRAVFG